MKRLLKWFARTSSPTQPARPSAKRRDPGQRLPPAGKSRAATAATSGRAHANKDVVELDPHFEGEITDNGPGKNVLIQNRYKREDTGTHDTLKILDNSVLDTGEEAGFDPYNTGRFDRSRNWDRRTRN